MGSLLPFNLCLALALVGLFFLHGTPWQAPVLIASLAALGVLFIARRESFARESIRQHNAFWGFAFGERAVTLTRLMAILVGLSCLALSAVSFAQVTSLWRP